MPELTGVPDADLRASQIKQDIKWLKKQDNSAENKKQISQKYDELYELQFQPHYMMLVMDSPKDYKYAYKHGFHITIDYGHKVETFEYKRFLGTAGSIKKSTIMFVDKNIHSKLMDKINNGRYEGPKNGEEAKVYAFAMAEKARGEGLRAQSDLMSRSLKAQMKYADKIKAKYTVVLGDDEVANKTAVAKNMLTKEQITLDLTKSIREQLK